VARSILALLATTLAFGTHAGAQQPTLISSSGHYAFHSDPWINLHHFLYQWARDELGLEQGRRRVDVVERASIGTLSASDRAAWERSLAFYRDSVARRGTLDAPMRDLNDSLVTLGGDPRSRPTSGIHGIAAALAAAMPIYLRSWWARHDSANRKWIAGVMPLVRRHEARFVETTTRLYGAAWPETPFRVDASAYANQRGGYTQINGHVVVYSTDRGVQDLYALEILFHEVQHARRVGGSVFGSLERAFAGARVPDNLWHALIFATAGAFTEEVAEREGLPGHVHYWIREGFAGFPGWGDIVPRVNEHWLPAVRGVASADSAYAALARSFAK
jgi:hypothetical protein